MKLKTVLWIGGIVLILAMIPAGILFWQNQQLKEQISLYAGELDINYKALNKSVQRAETKIAKNSTELDTFANQNGIDIKLIRNDLKTIGGRLEAIGTTEAKTTTVVHNHYSSDSSTNSNIDIPTCPTDGRPIDIHGYTKRIENRNIDDSNGMRVADISFSAADEKPWTSKVYGINYKILNTISRGENDQVILTTELTAENPEVQPGQTFRIDGVDSRVLQAPRPPPEFDWWDPSIFLMGQLGLIVYDQISFSAVLSVGFSIWSYGEDWRFFGISTGYDAFQNAFRLSFIPAMYNIGSPLPFLSDLWIFLDVGVSHQGSVSIGLGIATRM